MFTDMVGYTALGQRNESLSLALVEEQRKLIRPILDRHRGREVKTIGDAFLVEFGSALDAVRCAYEIQRATKEFNLPLAEDRRVHLRVGVHLGDVIESQGDISGDAVNVASRIEPLAEDGGVCITRQVYDHVKGKVNIPLSSLGPKSLKNVAEPIEVYRMVLPWEKEEVVPTLQLDRNRVAVLPFANMSPDPNDEYFAEGMTEELITALSKIRRLTVIARTSVMQYKNTTKRISEISRELGVGTLIEGSVRKSGNKLRITIQVIDSATEGHLWAENYNKQMDDVFAIQSEIAENVAKELRVQLAESEKAKLEKKPTTSTEAYTHYLKGRYYWNERTESSVRRGIDYLVKALSVDPNMALAYSDLADAYTIMADHGMMPGALAYAKVREYASRALEIDPTMSQPHAALANTFERSYHWDDCEREYKLAIELNPNNAVARHWHAINLFFTGNESEAVQEWRRARELDPLSLIVGCTLGYILVRTGSADEGLEMLQTVVEMNDSFALGHRQLGHSYVIMGKKEEAIREARKMLTLDVGPEMLLHVVAILASSGQKQEAAELLEKVIREQAAKYVDISRIGMAYAALGDSNHAFELLERAVDEQVTGVPYALSRFFPYFDAIRDTPRFKGLVRRAGMSFASVE
jgi:TolB-like protein/Flp pilus assembly protein TadD